MWTFLKKEDMMRNKVQGVLISHLLKHGSIELLLPDEIVLEIGITQENENGELIPKDDYCWLIATRKNRTACLDSFNCGVSYVDEKNIFVFEDKYTNLEGQAIKRLDVV